MALSVISPIEPALAKTGAILFQPFKAEKWFKLGFCAFLASLGGGGNCGGSGSGPWEDDPGSLGRGSDWVTEHLPVVLVVGILILGILILGILLAIWVTVLWLQSRGHFMFLDGVVKNRGAVVEPWNTYRAEGDGLFRFTLVLQLASGFVGACAVALGILLAWRDIQAERFDGSALLGLVVALVPLLFLGLTLFVVFTVLHDFVVPAMYQGRLSVGEGWRVTRSEVLQGRTGTLVLYLLMKLLISCAIAALTIGLICITLCILACVLAIPYIGTVILLPGFVFQRCYSLCFLEQLGGRWKLFAPPPPAEPAPAPA